MEIMNQVQLEELAEYMGMRMTDRQATLWMVDFRQKMITYDDFNFFSNYWRKNRDKSFKPADVFGFLSSTSRTRYNDFKFCDTCNHTGWVTIDNPKLPKHNYAYPCRCNSHKSVSHLKAFDDYTSDNQTDLFKFGILTPAIIYDVSGGIYN